MAFHRALSDRARRDYEIQVGRAVSPNEHLHLLLTSPDFAWLRPLSGLIVALDDLPDAPAQANEVWRVLLSPESSLWQRYSPTMATDSELAMAYGRVMEAYQKAKG